MTLISFFITEYAPGFFQCPKKSDPTFQRAVTLRPTSAHDFQPDQSILQRLNQFDRKNLQTDQCPLQGAIAS